MGKVLHYDGVVIGGGHNGMILAGYLAKSGLRVACVESEVELGGGLDSHEEAEAPGFWHNIHSFFHRFVIELPWYHDLKLQDFGIRYLTPDPGVAMILPDHRTLMWYWDAERTAASLARYSQRDARTFLDVHRRFQPVVQNIIFPHTYSVPLPFGQQQELLEHSEAGREYLSFAPKNADQVIKELFENDEIRAFMGFLVAMRGYELDANGLGYFVPGMIAGGVKPCMAEGSSHKLAHVLHANITALGADMIDAKAVTEIIVENGEAKGVRCRDGLEIRADFVASSLNPQITFLELIGAEKLDPTFASRVAGFKYSDVTPIISLNLCLKSPPWYTAAEQEPDVDKALMIICGLHGYADLEDLVAKCRSGRLPGRCFVNGAAPSKHDPTQAPPGRHTAFMWELAPYNLQEGPEHWDEIRDEHAMEILNMWRRYAPNLTNENIEYWFSYSPLDIERHNDNMRGGDWLVGELNEHQHGANRPLPELSGYMTPIKNLFLCGSSCHPGGNITGAPGFNAAGVIARERRLQQWWQSPDLTQRWQELK